jgi:hypothetical protein
MDSSDVEIISAAAGTIVYKSDGNDNGTVLLTTITAVQCRYSAAIVRQLGMAK